MADALDDARRDDGAEQQAGEIARHDESGGRGIEVLRTRPDADQRSMQAMAERQDGDAEQQHPDRSQTGKHQLPSISDCRLLHGDCERIVLASSFCRGNQRRPTCFSLNSSKSRSKGLSRNSAAPSMMALPISSVLAFSV